MDRDPRSSPESNAQQWTASDPTIWADYFNLGDGVESNTGNHCGVGDLPRILLSLPSEETFLARPTTIAGLFGGL
jgi:hypothetical protein